MRHWPNFGPQRAHCLSAPASAAGIDQTITAMKFAVVCRSGHDPDGQRQRWEWRCRHQRPENAGALSRAVRCAHCVWCTGRIRVLCTWFCSCLTCVPCIRHKTLTCCSIAAAAVCTGCARGGYFSEWCVLFAQDDTSIFAAGEPPVSPASVVTPCICTPCQRAAVILLQPAASASMPLLASYAIGEAVSVKASLAVTDQLCNTAGFAVPNPCRRRRQWRQRRLYRPVLGD